MRYCITIILGLILATSCKKSADDTPNFFTGSWQEQEKALQFAGSNYTVQFMSNGSFTMRIWLFTDIVNSGNGCEAGLNYVRGNWNTGSDHTIHFSGKYTDSSYQNDIFNPCMGSADFDWSPAYAIKRADTLILNPQMSNYAAVYLVRQ